MWEGTKREGKERSRKENSKVVFRIKAVSQTHNLGLSVSLKPFPSSVIPLETILFWTLAQGLQMLTVPVAAQHPAQMHQTQQQTLCCPDEYCKVTPKRKRVEREVKYDLKNLARSNSRSRIVASAQNSARWQERISHFAQYCHIYNQGTVQSSDLINVC